MQYSELKDSLEIVFKKENQDLWAGHPTFTVSKTKDEYAINYPHAETLIQLYLTVKTNEKQNAFFVNSLKKKIKDSEVTFWTKYKIYVGIASLCFYTLVSIGYVNEAVASLTKRKDWCGAIFNLILNMLPLNYFDLNQLDEISSRAIKDIENASHWNPAKEADVLTKKIVDLRYEIFSNKINEINLEINQDKKEVIKKIDNLGFNPAYNKLLNGIDAFLNTDTEKFINAGIISNLRTFMGDLLKDIAHKISEKEHEKIPRNNACSEMGDIRKYLKRKLELSNKDNKFIDSFIDILHAEGGHAFMSEKEYFRLARNIAIEIMFFTLSKYERKFV